MNLFDTRSQIPDKPATSIRVSDGDVLHLDWNKYLPGIIATASKDGVVRVWDTRNPGRPVAELLGHRLAARKVA
jgi:WD40 repeat protein